MILQNMMSLKNGRLCSTTGDKFKIQDYIFSRETTRKLICCGNCKNFKRLTMGKSFMTDCAIGSDFNGVEDDICEKWEIRE